MDERFEHAERWHGALRDWPGPLQLAWGMLDPVATAEVLEAVRELRPQAPLTELRRPRPLPPDRGPDPAQRRSAGSPGGLNEPLDPVEAGAIMPRFARPVATLSASARAHFSPSSRHFLGGAEEKSTGGG